MASTLFIGNIAVAALCIVIQCAAIQLLWLFARAGWRHRSCSLTQQDMWSDRQSAHKHSIKLSGANGIIHLSIPNKAIFSIKAESNMVPAIEELA